MARMPGDIKEIHNTVAGLGLKKLGSPVERLLCAMPIVSLFSAALEPVPRDGFQQLILGTLLREYGYQARASSSAPAPAPSSAQAPAPSGGAIVTRLGGASQGMVVANASDSRAHGGQRASEDMFRYSYIFGVQMRIPHMSFTRFSAIRNYVVEQYIEKHRQYPSMSDGEYFFTVDELGDLKRWIHKGMDEIH